ncbi:MAG: hypothetical protein AcusKO_07220 [Acuticoccus sp.]
MGPYASINTRIFVTPTAPTGGAWEKVVPEPLEIGRAHRQLRVDPMPDSNGFGDYTESGQVIPLTY